MKITYKVCYRGTGKKFAETDPDLGTGVHGTFDEMEGYRGAIPQMAECLKFFNERTLNTIGRNGDGMEEVVSSREVKLDVAVAWIDEYHDGQLAKSGDPKCEQPSNAATEQPDTSSVEKKSPKKSTSKVSEKLEEAAA